MIQETVIADTFYYRMKFPKKYKSSIEITKFEKNLMSQDPVRGRTKPLTYTFIDAFPKPFHQCQLHMMHQIY